MKKFKITIKIILLLGLFQSCKVTQDYTRPSFEIPKQYINHENKNLDKEIPTYKDFFSDKMLIKLIDNVVENNPDLNKAAEQVLASEAILRSVKLNYLPEINLQSSADFKELSRNGNLGMLNNNNRIDEYITSTSVLWEVDLWGKLKKQREEAKSDFLSLAENRRALRVQLIAQTADAYYNLINLDEQLSLIQKVRKSMEETLNILNVQYSVGDVTSLAVKQSEAQLSETNALIPEIEAQIKALENTLQVLAGNYPNSIERSESSNASKFKMEIDTGIPANLLENRPDVKQQELMLMAAAARVGIAKANFYPNIKITGSAGFNSTNLSNWFSIPYSVFGNLVGGITQPIFNKRQLKSNYEKELHLQKGAVQDFKKAVLNAVEEVSTTLSNISYNKNQMIEIANRKISMEKAVADANILYKYGEANYLEVQTVQQNYLQTELANAVAKQKEISLYIKLYKSLGGN